MKTKKNDIHLVAIDQVLIDKLYRLHEKNEHAEIKREYVFCNNNNPNMIFNRNLFYSAWHAAQDALGYTKKGDKGKDEHLFRPHDLKRTFIMESLDFGYDRSEIKAMTHNKSDLIFDGYVNTSRIKKLVSVRRATRWEIRAEEDKRQDGLRERLESGVWDMDKLEQMEMVIKKKKRELKESKDLNIKDSDVEI